MPFLTVFTPVYNRAYIIPQLYRSLCNQTCNNFEWVVVDDGSTDNIDEIMADFKSEGIICINYIKQQNGGKHVAINRGLYEAKGEYFFIVDSDDFLTADAVEWIMSTAASISGDERYAGLSGIRILPGGSKIGGGNDFGTIDSNALDIRYKYGISGDLAEVYRTKILRLYPFPIFSGERFCPEALVWNRIADKYLVRYCYKGIYVCEYLPDGLTAKITRLRHTSPNASMTYYSELYHKPVPFLIKAKAAVNFWRFARCLNGGSYRMISLLSLLSWLPGKAMRINDARK